MHPPSVAQILTFAVHTEQANGCLVCKRDRHPLYVCPSFRAMNHEEKASLLKEKKLCINCLGHGHFAKNC